MTPTRWLTVAAGIAALLLLAGAAGATPSDDRARAVTPIDGCATITEPGHYRLTADVVDSSARECILIRADDVVFDGGGHTIDGQGPEAGDHRIPIRVGYSNQYRVHNVTVRDVVVTEWFQGVGVSRASHNVVRNVTARRNGQYGIYLGDHADHNLVVDSTVTDTTENGIFLADLSNDNRLENVTARRNGNGFSVYDSNGNRLVGNTATGNENNGFFLGRDSSGNVLEDNVARSNGDGFAVYRSDDNRLVNNTASGNERKGYFVTAGSGNNTLRGNGAESNGGAGFRVLNSTGTVLAADVAGSNGASGFSVVRASQTVLRDVSASGNDGPAVRVRDSEGTAIRELAVGRFSLSFDAAGARVGRGPAGEEAGDLVPVGRVIRLDAAEPVAVSLAVRYDPAELDDAGVAEDSLVVWRFGQGGSAVDGVTADPGTNRLEGEVQVGGDAAFGLAGARSTATPGGPGEGAPRTTAASNGSSPSDSTVTPGQPGFGVVVAVFAMGLLALLASRRR